MAHAGKGGRWASDPTARRPTLPRDRAASARVPLAVIAKWLRQADASTTARIYAHSQDDALRAFGQSLGAGGLGKLRSLGFGPPARTADIRTFAVALTLLFMPSFCFAVLEDTLPCPPNPKPLVYTDFVCEYCCAATCFATRYELVGVVNMSAGFATNLVSGGRGYGVMRVSGPLANAVSWENSCGQAAGCHDIMVL